MKSRFAEAVDALLEISMPENMTIEVFVKGIPYTASDHVKDPARDAVDRVLDSVM